ncbi:MAG: ATP-binding cassette domain-containing protein [Planctomycetales bacterium]|nr:ATP-binding cassette domain-containing protein [Planctomycetales bacterium]
MAGRETVSAGRHSGCDLYVGDDSVAPRHCMFISPLDLGDHGEGSVYVLVQDGAVFVNGECCLARRLAEGDLIQIGRYAWTFDAKQRSLHPAEAIRGAVVEVMQIAIAGRLAPSSFKLSAGALTALRGPSGSGKSTLVSALLGSLQPDLGRIDFLDRDRQPLDDPAVGYVPQKSLLPRQLTPRQAVQYAGLLRGLDEKTLPSRVVDALRDMDLPGDCWDRRLKDLSGGEERRVQTAAEIVHRPDLLVLDEPASGLDTAHERRLVTTLRNLARRGATVLVVTHGGADDLYDQTISLVPADRASREAWEVTATTRDGDDSPIYDVTPVTCPPNARPVRSPTPWRRQLITLVQRNADILLGDCFSRIALPWLLLPAVFASALTAAVSPYDPALLGFLVVLSCTWLGASVGHLAVAEERDFVEHERITFLSPSAYLAAKWVTVSMGAVVQALVLLVMLLVLQRSVPWETPWVDGGPDPMLAAPALVLTSLAGASWGLLISVVAGRAPSRAAFLLPLLMVAQIVFSVEIGGHGRDSVVEAYRDFLWNSAETTPAARASYLTVSRWGDMAVRTAANPPGEGQAYWWDGVACLAGMAVGIWMIAWALMPITGRGTSQFNPAANRVRSKTTTRRPVGAPPAPSNAAHGPSADTF